MNDHYINLERMYLSAPVQKIYTGIGISVKEGSASISLPVQEKFFHAGGSLHGSVYFRMMDDAAYFAASSLVRDVFLLTSSFQIDFLRPVTKGSLRAEGRVLHKNNSIFLASADLYDERDRLVATGKGTFMKSKTLLNSIDAYEKNRS